MTIHKIIPHIAAALLLLIMALLAGGAVRRESVTFDEVAHTGAGVSYLQRLDLRMNEEHPPLAKVLAAIPLVIRGAHADYSHISWTFSEKIMNQLLGEWVFGHWFVMRWNDPVSTLFWARIPMLLLMLLLGIAIYTIAWRLGGPWGGLLCLTAYVTTPAFLAFGPLVLTDVAVTLFWVLTTWQLAEMWESPGRGAIARFGLVFAGALLSKFSSGLMFFVFIAVVASMRLRPLPGRPNDKAELRSWRRRGWRNFALGTLWAALFVYITYLVLSWNQSTQSFNVIPHFPASAILRRLLMPAWLYLRGIAFFALSAGSRPTYILGHAYPHGVWFYFPILFLLKSQLAFLLLLALATVAALLIKQSNFGVPSAIPKGMELRWRCLWISLLVFTAACLLSQLDLSIRHFLIPLALITILLAPLPRMLQSLRAPRPTLALIGFSMTSALAVVAVVVAIRSYPNYIPFLNSLTGGRPGYLLVNDSNLDWNQSLPEVEAFAKQHALKHVLLDEYGVSDPSPYVPEAESRNCQQPSANDGGQWFVVSANNLFDSHNCLWLMSYTHVQLAGGSMYAFNLPPAIPAEGAPGGPPLPADYHYFGGIKDFDMTPIFLTCIHDPQLLQPTWDHMMLMAQDYRNKNKH